MAVIRTSDRLSGGGVVVGSRPADWLTMPTLADGDEKVHLLVANYDNESNFFAVQMVGAYTVDLGDGSAPTNHALGEICSRTIDFNGLSSGSETSEGFRQAIVTITPQAGQSLTSVRLAKTHASSLTGYVNRILDIVVAGQSIADIQLWSGNSYTTMLKYFKFVGTSSMSTAASMFYNISSSPEIDMTSVGTITNFSSCFQNAVVDTIPLLDTSSASTVFRMFFTSQVRHLPLFNLSSCTNFQQMLFGNRSVIEVPAWDMSAATNATQFARGCASLSRCRVTGVSTDIDFADCNFGPAALNEIFTNLADVTGNTKSIDVHGNWGAPACDPTIATAKGWTVVTA